MYCSSISCRATLFMSALLPSISRSMQRSSSQPVACSCRSSVLPRMNASLALVSFSIDWYLNSSGKYLDRNSSEARARGWVARAR